MKKKHCPVFRMRPSTQYHNLRTVMELKNPEVQTLTKFVKGLEIFPSSWLSDFFPLIRLSFSTGQIRG